MNRNIQALLFAAMMTSVAYAQSPQPVLEHVPPAESMIAVRPTASESKIDVVFVLDTTGSMGGLIEGAKQKIWDIANRIALAKPKPEIRMGLVAYRDRSDDYVTQLTPLTSDLDAVYSNLMGFSASGGGDGPESVNQALNEAVTRFDWDRGANTLRIIYLVGDAPPHMDYEQDVLYAATCERAAKEGIVVNTIQCGADPETMRVWQEIARASEGDFVAIQQSGGVVAVATPYDAEIASLGRKIDETVIGYGSRDDQMRQVARLETSSRLAEDAPASVGADRAVFKACAAGAGAIGGSQELVNDVAAGRVRLRDLKDEELPEDMRKLDAGEREQFVEAKARQREEVQKQINELNVKRQRFIDDQRAASGTKGDSFDAAVFRALRQQAAKKGIRFEDR